MRRSSRIPSSPRAATTTETLILMVLVAMVILSTIKLFGGTLSSKAKLADESLSGVSTESSASLERRRQRKAYLEREAKRKRTPNRTRHQDPNHGSSAPIPTPTAAAPASRRPGGRAGGGRAGGASVSATPRPKRASSTGDRAARGSATAPSTTVGCAGFNPFIIVIGLGLGGFLGYIVLKSNKG